MNEEENSMKPQLSFMSGKNSTSSRVFFTGKEDSSTSWYYLKYTDDESSMSYTMRWDTLEQTEQLTWLETVSTGHTCRGISSTTSLKSVLA